MTPDEFAEQLTEARRSGDYQRQIDLLRDSCSYAQQTLNVTAEIESMRLLANVYQDLGDLKQAHTWRLEALGRAEQPDAGIPDETRMALEGDLGRSAIEARDWSQAEYRTRAALELAEQLGHQRGRCLYRVNLLLILAGSSRIEEARELSRDIRPTILELGDPHLLALYFLNTSNVLLNDDRKNEALRYARLSQAFAAQLGAPEGATVTAWADLAIGLCHLAPGGSGKPGAAGAAEKALRRAVATASEGGMPFNAGLDRALAQMYAQTGRLEEAISQLRNQLEHLERARQDFGYEDFQRSFFQVIQPDYDIVITLMLRQDDAENAFLATELARSRLLLAQLGRGPALWADWTPAERQKLQAAAGAYGARAVGYPTTHQPGPELAEARNQFLNVYDAHRSLRPQWTAGILERSPVGAPEARTLLGPGQAMLSYFVTEQTTIVFTITADGLHFQHLPYPRRQARDDVAELDRAFDAVREQNTRSPAVARDLEARLEQLYAILIAPVLASVNGATHWMVVPHGPLHGIPWAALRGDGRYLVQDHTVSLLPSATFAASWMTGPSAQPATPALLIAGPGLGAATAEKEIDGVARALGITGPPDLVCLRGPDASVEAYLENAPTARLIHAACHSAFDSHAALLSFLRLAGTRGADSPAPECLHAYEIMGRPSSAALVTLASCASGSSSVQAGDEQFGLVRAYLTAGAQSVLSAQREVYSRASKELFSRFYPLARTQPLALALALAQREMINGPVYSSPVFWAPFVLTGKSDTTLGTMNQGA